MPDTATPDTKRLREVAELPWFPVPDGITRDVVLSLLDRIEEQREQLRLANNEAAVLETQCNCECLDCKGSKHLE